MAYDDLGFNFVQMLREALVPPKPDETMRTCDCPIVFEDRADLVSQVHRYDCPVGIRQRSHETQELPRCIHGNHLRDWSGERLEPKCGCVKAEDHTP